MEGAPRRARGWALKTRIKAVVYVDVYDEEDAEPTAATFDDARGWVEAALRYGDKHASGYSSWVDVVHSIALVEDDE